MTAELLHPPLTAADPATLPWPPDELESLERCPVCGEPGRQVLHTGLSDGVFRCAPGVWTMYRCGNCGSAYLDPRPSERSIGLAYRRYFTHDERPAPEYAQLTAYQRVRRALRNGYLRSRYPAWPSRPAWRIAGPALRLDRTARARLDYAARNIPVPRAGARLLDIGCGGGGFLALARQAGYEVVGLDPDPVALKVASKQGVAVVQAGLPATGLKASSFDVITLSHVVEHLHNPVKGARELYRLLRPGGLVWLSTPNIESDGHRIFGRDWRGLECLRHLVLFTPASLAGVLRSAGFAHIALHRTMRTSWFDASLAISEGRDPVTVPHPLLPPALKRLERKTIRNGQRHPEMNEEMVITARR
ncbi:MAG TPA: class I SAM-dependent methyltransferase [Chloroflexota bacterium]